LKNTLKKKGNEGKVTEELVVHLFAMVGLDLQADYQTPITSGELGGLLSYLS
jgi:hypothetical protein